MDNPGGFISVMELHKAEQAVCAPSNADLLIGSMEFNPIANREIGVPREKGSKIGLATPVWNNLCLMSPEWTEYPPARIQKIRAGKIRLTIKPEDLRLYGVIDEIKSIRR